MSARSLLYVTFKGCKIPLFSYFILRRFMVAYRGLRDFIEKSQLLALENISEDGKIRKVKEYVKTELR